MSFLSALRDLKRRVWNRPPKPIRAGTGVIVHRPHRRIQPSEDISIGAHTIIGSNALIAPIHEYAGVPYEPEIRIGKSVYIGPNLYMACASSISIEDGCVLSESVFLNDNGHGLDPLGGPIMDQPLITPKPIVIGRGSFLGLRSAIMPGVILGPHCVVGINSVVTRSFPAYSMVAGAPARLIRTFCAREKRWVYPPNID